jgi:hypothetical protein
MSTGWTPVVAVLVVTVVATLIPATVGVAGVRVTAARESVRRVEQSAVLRR